MKNLSFLFIVLLLLQFTSPAQQGWFWQNPLPQGNLLNDIYVFDENTANAVGNTSTVIKITDAGTSWNTQHYVGLTTELLKSVHFIDDNAGWVVGGNGIILNTTDGGTSWNNLTSGTTTDLRSVYFSENTGWVVGGRGGFPHDLGIILKTTGLSITSQN